MTVGGFRVQTVLDRFQNVTLLTVQLPFAVQKDAAGVQDDLVKLFCDFKLNGKYSEV